jgi:hypothetical protein
MGKPTRQRGPGKVNPLSDRSVAPEDYEGFSRSTDSDVGTEQQHAEPEPALTWQPKEYNRVVPGTYEGVAIRCQGPNWVRAFGRWGLLIEFELDSATKVCSRRTARPTFVYGTLRR